MLRLVYWRESYGIIGAGLYTGKMQVFYEPDALPITLTNSFYEEENCRRNVLDGVNVRLSWFVASDVCIYHVAA